MKKECKTHLIPTEEITGIVLHGSGLDPFYNTNKNLGYHEAVYAVNNIGGTYQHLYITDDSKIGEGDWFINETNSYIGLGLCQVTSSREGSSKLKTPKSDSHFVAASIKYLQKEDGFRKIIASTDKSLGLPMIQQDFIKQYCENPVESVMVEYEERCIDDKCNGSGKCGPCIITKLILKLKGNCIIISPIEEKMYSKEEVIEKGKGLLDKLEIEEDDVQEYFDEWVKENL